jgi:dTDP-4-dehydrorhamnose 3,5-epimerase
VIKDLKTVNKDGQSIQTPIEGVAIRHAKTIADERGSICEMYDLRWDYHPEPLVYAYHVTIRPKMVKGWVCHEFQDDRSFFSMGEIQVVLYDARPESPTYGKINEFVVGTNNRALLTIPKGVWHALRNIGDCDAVFVNMPTQPFNHDNPDKYRLPLDNDVIPYKFK